MRAIVPRRNYWHKELFYLSCVTVLLPYFVSQIFAVVALTVDSGSCDPPGTWPEGSAICGGGVSWVGWPAKFRETKFREMFREIFISHFAKFNDSRNFAKQNIWKFREISRNWSYKTVQKQLLSPFYSLILIESEFQLNISWFRKQVRLWR